MEPSTGPRPPGSIPIGSRIAVPDGAAYEPVRRALAAIDAVHGDGDLPLLPVTRTRAATEVGAYEWSERTGDPLRLRLSVHNGHPELTVVHEIGHFLDHQALGRPGTFASETDALISVMRAINGSAASDSLHMLRGRQHLVVRERGKPTRVRIKRSFIEYFLSPPEQFARACAQFIAVMSRSPYLATQLDVLRQSPLGVVYHSQWEDDDFWPIQQQFDRLLRRVRWMNS